MEGKSVKPARVRFAPSPTGPLNLGGARTALFGWLYARHENGQFILRIEDTDLERSKPEFEEDIKRSLEWLGLTWDEFYRQTERIGIYETYLKKLIDEEKAYYCFCTEEELESERQAQMSQGLPPKYSGKCREFSKEEAEKKVKAGERSVIRFKMPQKHFDFNDLVRGKVSFDAGLFGDIIIAKGIREPLYNFANVIDDFEMDISLIVRGEEHISNTPRQMALQEAFGFPELTYAHLPLLLGANRKKLSKRDLAKSILDYKNEGYLPEAVLNFLVLLGWHPKEDRETITVPEMIEEFSFGRVQKSGGIFNEEKLDWLNGHYIREMKDEELSLRLLSFIPETWLSPKERFEEVIHIEKERLKKLSDFPKFADFFFETPNYFPDLLVWKKGTKEDALQNLKKAHELLEGVDTGKFSKRENLETLIMPIAEIIGKGDVLWPLRAALSGKMASPDPFDLLTILRKEESLKRIREGIKKLESK